MEENMNYLFNEKVGDVQCKFDGKLWIFENINSQDNMIIPVKSISNVHLSRVRSWMWLIYLVLAIAIAIISGVLAFDGNDDVAWIFYGLAIALGILAIITLFFSVEYTISIVPHSKIVQKIVSRRKNVLTNLHEALINSLRKNF